MKKIFFFLFAAVMTVSFISCINEYELTIEECYGPITYIGTKKPNETRAVGDIVFTDGSATPYSATLTLTDDQKNAAVAVIYKVVGTDSYGVGLVQASDKTWCSSSANGFSKIDDIICTPSGTAANYTFESNADTDGSNNLAKIGEAGATDDTGNAANYPAFYFAINYKEQDYSHVNGTRYASGWYLPSVSELYDIWSKKNDVNNSLAKCGDNCNSLSNSSYWSSSQVSNLDNSAYTLSFQNGEIISCSKTSTENTTRCIRQF